MAMASYRLLQTLIKEAVISSINFPLRSCCLLDIYGINAHTITDFISEPFEMHARSTFYQYMVGSLHYVPKE